MRALIVEDEPDLLGALAGALREDGYAVDTSPDGEDGLFKANSAPYDVILLDLMLPTVSGFDILKKLRSTGNTVPILVLTARDTVRDRVRGLDAGADDYVLKPFDLMELLARLRALIRRNAGVASADIKIGNVVIDTARKTVVRDGQNVLLTAREYALAELLAMHRGKLVSRSVIYDHLFADDDDNLSNLVEVYIHNVRKKLGRDIIETRRGLGYVMNDTPSLPVEEARV